MIETVVGVALMATVFMIGILRARFLMKKG